MSATRKNLIIIFVVSLLLFTPITGFILDDYDLIIHLSTPLIITIIITAVSFLILLLNNNWSKISKKIPFDKEQLLKLSKQAAYTLNQNSIYTFVKAHKTSLGLFACILIPFLASKYWVTVFILALIYVLLGVGLNIVVGYAGLLDLGYVGFYAIGAYTYALGSQYFDLSFWVAIPLGAFLAGIFGAILAFPVLRMHGDYLAIVTLGFGEIIRLILNNWTNFTNGPNGVITPQISIMGLEFTRVAKNGGIPFHEFFNIAYHSKLKYILIYVILLSIVTLVIKFSSKLRTMPIGRAWEALRENEIACRSLGIYHVTTKLSAFSIGAAIGGIGGVFFAAYQGFVNPSSFTFFESALILAIVVLGGMGSNIGVVIAALTLTILPEFLREFSEIRMFLFGLLMVLMMIFKPGGFVKLKRPVINHKS